MLFPTHLVVAALLGRGTRLPLAWLMLGGALPDLVDKPLASAGVVGVYQSVGHSLLFGVVVGALALSTRPGVAVAVGWVSHLVLDAVHLVLNGRPEHVGFLGWPMTTPADPLGLPPVSFALQYVGTPSFFLEIALWLGAAGLVFRWLRRRHIQPSDTAADL